ncbi:putative secreted effector protein [Blumeria graminis f. sp. tritici 96224]|uniref:BgtE-6037 n=1 Tax=Blumeria graminis f. sp. tritici 96224 TaxID=1268274 RepID=A0A061HGI9_BLUGR|nr:putative secreted effector protein [Blumeria graminis f. sp. tritici 96224]
MIAWTVLYILTLLPLYFANPPPRKSLREVFKCSPQFISMDQAQEAVKLGCSQMQVALPTSLFPASFIESELFDLTNIVLFTWPVFISDNILRVDYGVNRVVFDSSCRLIGLIQIDPNGPKPCPHLVEAGDLNLAYKLEIYNVPWKNLPLYGFKYENEIYFKNELDEFVISNLNKFHDDSHKNNVLEHYPSDVNEANSGIWTRTIRRGPTGIEIPKGFINRRLIINSLTQIIGITRKAWKDWRPLAELRSLDHAYRMKVFLEREPDMSYEPLNDINFKGIYLSAAMIKSNLHMACKVITERNMGTHLIVGYPYWTDLETISDHPVLKWPLRMPETFVHEDSNSNAGEIEDKNSDEKSDTLFY